MANLNNAKYKTNSYLKQIEELLEQKEMIQKNVELNKIQSTENKQRNKKKKKKNKKKNNNQNNHKKSPTK